MKPRNDLEKKLQRVIDSGKLTPLTSKQMEQAHLVMDRHHQTREFAMTTKQTINGMKLTKCYKVHRYGRGSMMTFFNLVLVKAECEGKTAFAARCCNMGVVDSFSHNGKISIKDERFFYEDYLSFGWPLRSIGKEYPYAVVRHYNHNDFEFRDSRIETLAKCGGEALIQEIMVSEKALSDHVWSAYKIALRHGYDFQGELWKWIRMVELLRLNKKDYRNPVFVCPDNLADAYNRLVDLNDKRLKRLADLREKKKEEDEFKRALKYEEQYIKEHKKLLGLVIIGKGINIKPLQNILDFKNEGDSMHHCVFSGAYYKKKDMLIMSAKDDEGKRIATIEYDLKRLAVLQCRAACNKKPEQYDEILSLIKSHTNDFRTSKKLQPCKQYD
ncbi:MAG: PcfJ domain-containing protein [Bacteroidales bacterium]|nr:PcfJ domain-containing protein [Bacteroidales bacterium]